MQEVGHAVPTLVPQMVKRVDANSRIVKVDCMARERAQG